LIAGLALVLVLGLVTVGISAQFRLAGKRGIAPAAGRPEELLKFFSAGCADCWPYVQEQLMPALEAAGLTAPAVVHDYTVPGERSQLLTMADSLEMPRSIADSIYAFIPLQGGTLVVLGHVPADLVRQALAEPELPERLVIWQPQMHGEPDEYRLWAWAGEVSSYPIDMPLKESLPQAVAAGDPLPIGLANLGELLPVVIATGLLDSVNPCAFAVILLLIALLFTIRQSRQRVVQLGLVYIGMIFLVYFAIGLGILRAVRLSDDPHFVARAGSWLLIALGGTNLAELFLPRFPIKLHMPAAVGDKTNEWLKKAMVPATVAVGFLVGLCTFPCSGGIYVSIITLPNAKTTLGWGVGYLALYNVLFVLPLLAILAAAGNRATAKRWAAWEREHSRRIRLGYGLVMIALGTAMLLWLIG
jgi:cytochrome c biogenesis protein CcdA